MTKSVKGGAGASKTVMSPLINVQENFFSENTFDAPSQVYISLQLRQK